MARIWAVVLCLLAGMVRAEMSSLFPSTARQPTVVPVSATPSSLFSGGQVGMFAPVLARPSAPDTAPADVPLRRGGTEVDRLLSLIARAEAGPAGYDAVQHGARVQPPAPPTSLTLGEIYAWIEATPGQPHAIGRYQFIPSTLRRVAAERGFGPDVPFTPDVQDSLALVLLEDAGLSAFQAGSLERRAFMQNLARIWAGLPLPNGRSYYEGHAGNRATMTWAAFERGMERIWEG